MTCRLCEPFSHIPITTPPDLKKAIAALKSATRRGHLLVVGKGLTTDDPFNALNEDTPWPDTIGNYFKCTRCNQFFVLHAETYHGSGGAIEAISAPPDDMVPDSL